MIDTHTHIYLPEFEDDLQKIIQNAHQSGVNQMLLPAIDSSTHAAMMGVEERFPSCLCMIGLHPCSVKSDYLKELQIIESLLSSRKFVAIGETGLDFYWDKTFVKEQYELFRYQAKLALQHHLPLVIHSRSAIDECIEVVEEFPGLEGVFHCFSGNTAQAERIVRLGWHLGIGGVVTFKNAGLDKVMEKLALDKVVLETDAPYLAPVPFRGKRNEPAYLRLVAEKLAELKGVKVDEIIKITSQNARNLFKLGN